jgi:hemin uptake protein HemP
VVFFSGLAGGRCDGCNDLLAATSAMQAIRLHRPFWLRGDSPTVNDCRPLFISIVNRSGWIAPAPNCTSEYRQQRRGATNTMTATSEDKFADAGTHAENPSAATRSVGVNGNRIDSRELFSTEREIIIGHGDENYRLRLTSQNKLILTK